MLLTVIRCSKRLQTSTRPHEYNRPSLSLLFQVMNTKCSSIHHTLEHNIDQIVIRFLQIPVLECFELEIICARGDSGIGEDVVDTAEFFFCEFEE